MDGAAVGDLFTAESDADIAHIKELVQAHEVGQVLVGMPFRLDGKIGPAAKFRPLSHC